MSNDEPIKEEATNTPETREVKPEVVEPIESPKEFVPPQLQEVPAKPKATYETVQANENHNLALVRKSNFIDFTLDDLLNFIRGAKGDKELATAQVQYNKAIIENIKGFHPEVYEIYQTLPGEKQSAMLLMCKAITEHEKFEYMEKEHVKEIDKYTAEIAEIEEATGLTHHE